MTDGDTPVCDLSDAAAVHERLDDLEADLATVTERVDALDATVQSLHGYVGELEAVNDRVERRADAARAAVERLEDEHDRSLGRTRDARTDGNRGSEPPDADDAPERERGQNDDSADGTSGDTRFPTKDGDHDAFSFDARGDDDDSLFDRVRESL